MIEHLYHAYKHMTRKQVMELSNEHTEDLINATVQMANRFIQERGAGLSKWDAVILAYPIPECFKQHIKPETLRLPFTPHEILKRI